MSEEQDHDKPLTEADIRWPHMAIEFVSRHEWEAVRGMAILSTQTRDPKPEEWLEKHRQYSAGADRLHECADILDGIQNIIAVEWLEPEKLLQRPREDLARNAKELDRLDPTFGADTVWRQIKESLPEGFACESTDPRKVHAQAASARWYSSEMRQWWVNATAAKRRSARKKGSRHHNIWRLRLAYLVLSMRKIDPGVTNEAVADRLVSDGVAPPKARTKDPDDDRTRWAYILANDISRVRAILGRS